MEKEYMMRVFPTLEEYWDRDNGEIFTAAYDYFGAAKEEFYAKWEEVKQNKKEEYPLRVFEIERYSIRLVPDEEDERPYCSEEMVERWEALSTRSLDEDIYLGRENYLKLMEELNAFKLPDERNCKIMEAHLMVNHEIERMIKEIGLF